MTKDKTDMRLLLYEMVGHIGIAFHLLYIAVFLAEDAFAQTSKNFTLGGDLITTVQIMEKDDYTQCYVDVVVHNSSSFKFGLKDALVTALSGRVKERPRYSQANTSADGKVCLPVECTQEVRLFVEKNTIRIPALNKTMQQRNIPVGYLVQFETGNEVIKFQAYAWGNLQGKNGPVYNVYQKNECKNGTLNNYHFVFSYITIPDQLYATPVPTTGLGPGDSGFQFMWRYGIQGSGTDPQTCFMKVKFKVLAEVNVTASSVEDGATGTLLGTFTTGPQFNTESSVLTDKAACIEYRCPVVDIMTGGAHDTYIQGSIDVPGMPAGCCVRFLGKPRQVFKANSTSFWTEKPIQQNDKYGPTDGIYMHETPQIARSRCFTGRDYLDSEYSMDVNTGYAFEYDCIAASCPVPVIVG